MLANDNTKYRAGMFLIYKNKIVVVDSGATKLGVLVFPIDDPSEGFYAKPEDLSVMYTDLGDKVTELLLHSQDIKIYTPRSDLLQLKTSPYFDEIVNKLNTFLDSKKYIIEPSILFEIPKRMFNIENTSLQVWTYQTDPDWKRYYSKSSNYIDGVTINSLSDEDHMQQHIFERMEKLPYVYYHNGMLVANPQYFDACWNME